MKLQKLLAAGIVTAALPGSLIFAAEAELAVSAAATSASASSATEPEELAEIKVTARRREEELQDVPLPITVVTAAAIDDTGSFNVQRLEKLAPTLQFYASNPRNSQINIRGLGAPFGLTNDGIEQGVGLYVDDVYYSRAASSTLDFLDVERIEVLRGPQGTLYGKNTTAGAVNITTRKPTFDPEARAELSIGNLGFYQAKAALSGPLVGDSLAGRVAISATTRQGTLASSAIGARVNELDNIGIHGQFLWRASDNLDVTLAGDYNKQNPECCAQVFVRYGSTQRAAARQYPALSAAFNYTAPANPFDRVTNFNSELSARSELGGAALRAVWDLGAAGTLTSVTAWRYWDWLPKNDRDFTGLPLTLKSENPSHQDQYTQEFRYNYSGERFDYVVGLFGYKQTVHTDGLTQLGSGASRWMINRSGGNNTLAADDPATLNGLRADNNIDFKNTSAALFGQLSWKVTDQFRVEPGVRLNYDDKTGSYISVVTNGAGLNVPEDLTNSFYTSPPQTALERVRRLAQRDALTPQHYAATFSDWNVSGDLKLSYELTPDVLAYASYARSFKTGGITLNGVPLDANGTIRTDLATVRPEKVGSYELGFKTQFLERKVTANLAVFRTDVKDFQLTVNNGETSTIRGYLANAPKVKIQGAELDFSYRPNRSLNFYVNGAYTDAIYEKFAPDYVALTGAPCPPETSGGSTTSTDPAVQFANVGVPGSVSPRFCDLTGQWLPAVSKWAGSWGFQYQHAGNFLGREGEAYFGYEGNARSKWSSNPSRSIYTDVPGYGLTNFRLGFRSRGTWDAYVWVKNAFAKDYYEQLNAATGGNTGLVVGQPADPRTWGLTVRAEF